MPSKVLPTVLPKVMQILGYAGLLPFRQVTETHQTLLNVGVRVFRKRV